MTEQPTPVISVVVVNWNGGDLVVDCLRSLREHPPSVPWEAVLVDNASSDGSVERVRARAARTCASIANRRNLGLAAANNQGIRALTQPLRAHQQPRRALPTGCDRRAARAARAPGAGRVRRRQAARPGRHAADLGRRPPDAPRGAARPGRVRSWPGPDRDAGGADDRPAGFWWHGWDHGTEQSDRARRRGVLPRAAGRRSTTIGLQDESFVLDWEGIDWSRRADEAGLGDLVLPAGRGRAHRRREHPPGAVPLGRLVPPRHVPLLRRPRCRRPPDRSWPRRSGCAPG